MWLVTRYGFFSIVCAGGPNGRPHPKLLMVRARKREHLEILQDLNVGLGEIVKTPYHDYPFRIIATRGVVDELCRRLAADVNYSNFKKAAADTMDDVDYDHFLHETWVAGTEMNPAADDLYSASITSLEETK